MPIDLEDRGRALENEYFRRKEQELIEKLRAHMAVENAHDAGMNCPRCDGRLLEADYQHMVSVLDVLQQLEITKVGLATEAAATQ